MTSRPHSSGLVLRLYLLLGLAVGASVLLLTFVGYVVFGPPDRRPASVEGREARVRIVRVLADIVLDGPADPAARSHRAARVSEATGVGMAIYDDDGTLLVEAGSPPGGPLAPGDVERLAAGGLVELAEPGRVAVRLGDEPGTDRPAYGLFRFPPRMPAGVMGEQLLFRVLPPPLLILLAALLAVLAVVSFVFVRSLVTPIRRLSEVAQALGGGDLTARAQMERRDELGELGRAFDTMADRLVATLRGQTELIANASHELRTPLARIRVAIDIAAEGDAELARRQLGEIATDLVELEALVSDILLMARLDLERDRIDGPRQPLHLESMAGCEVVDAAAEHFRRDHDDRELRVEADGSGWLRGDRVLLRRVLGNLLDNAAKCSDSARPIVLRAQSDAETIVWEVRDEGIGIDPKDLQRVFTPFFRTDYSRSRATGGTGLGLALARRVVEAHGGSIDVESVPGRGSTFRVTLPAET